MSAASPSSSATAPAAAHPADPALVRTAWNPEPQWLLDAQDLERAFALKGVLASGVSNERAPDQSAGGSRGA